MQELIVRFDKALFYDDTLDTISNRLACAEAHYLIHAPWPSYPYKPVSVICGSPASYFNGRLKSLYQTIPVFKHPHDVLVDDEDNLYVCQWNSGKVYPYKFSPV